MASASSSAAFRLATMAIAMTDARLSALPTASAFAGATLLAVIARPRACATHASTSRSSHQLVPAAPTRPSEDLIRQRFAWHYDTHALNESTLPACRSTHPP